MPPVSADLATTATISTTGASSIAISTATSHWHGISFLAGSAANLATINAVSSAGDGLTTFKSCKFTLNNTSTSSRINFCNAQGAIKVILDNCTVKFGQVQQAMNCRNTFEWRNTASAIDSAGSTPTTLFTNSGQTAIAKLIGVDLSLLGSGNNIFDISPSHAKQIDIVDCKLGASVSITTGSVAGGGGSFLRLVNCDSANTNYRYYKQNYQGTITHETTIVRTGGASDGTTTFSRKMVTTANSKFYSPLESDPIIIWNEITGSPVTVNIPVITDGVTLKNNDAWIEVEYLGTSGFPLGTFQSNAAADVLATGANQPTDTGSTWTTTGLASPVLQLLSATFTPQVKGPYRVTVKLALASTTMYFDPKNS